MCAQCVLWATGCTHGGGLMRDRGAFNLRDDEGPDSGLVARLFNSPFFLCARLSHRFTLPPRGQQAVFWVLGICGTGVPGMSDHPAQPGIQKCAHGGGFPWVSVTHGGRCYSLIPTLFSFCPWRMRLMVRMRVPGRGAPSSAVHCRSGCCTLVRRCVQEGPVVRRGTRTTLVHS